MDISGKQLENVLTQQAVRPSFIKPNTHELEELVGKEILSTEELITILKEPLFDNIETIMISQGATAPLSSIIRQSMMYKFRKLRL